MKKAIDDYATYHFCMDRLSDYAGSIGEEPHKFVVDRIGLYDYGNPSEFISRCVNDLVRHTVNKNKWRNTYYFPRQSGVTASIVSSLNAATHLGYKVAMVVQNKGMTDDIFDKHHPLFTVTTPLAYDMRGTDYDFVICDNAYPTILYDREDRFFTCEVSS